MIQIIPSEQRHFSDFGWLQARWHFSFGHYHDPANMGWGPLRVFNDDIIKGGGGFDTHPHRDMEIVTWVIDGALEHADDLGHKEALLAGEAQVMSAGTGITHAEYNHSATEPVRLIQLWIKPRTAGSKPRWDQRPFDPAARAGKMLPIVSSGNLPDTLKIDQDATIFVASLAAGDRVLHELAPGRKAYLFAISGDVDVNGKVLSGGDQARISDEASVELIASAANEVMLLDLPG